MEVSGAPVRVLVRGADPEVGGWPVHRATPRVTGSVGSDSVRRCTLGLAPRPQPPRAALCLGPPRHRPRHAAHRGADRHPRSPARAPRNATRSGSSTCARPPARSRARRTTASRPTAGSPRRCARRPPTPMPIRSRSRTRPAPWRTRGRGCLPRSRSPASGIRGQSPGTWRPPNSRRPGGRSHRVRIGAEELRRLAAEAVAAVDGLGAGRAERDASFLATAVAGGREHLAWAVAVATAVPAA